MVVEVRLGQSVLYGGHGTSCPEVQVEDSRQDDDLHISREVTSTRAPGSWDGTGFRRDSKTRRRAYRAAALAAKLASGIRGIAASRRCVYS